MKSYKIYMKFKKFISGKWPNPFQEKTLKLNIPNFGEISALSTSVEVRDQYEQNPYPRWRVIQESGRNPETVQM